MPGQENNKGIPPQADQEDNAFDPETALPTSGIQTILAEVHRGEQEQDWFRYLSFAAPLKRLMPIRAQTLLPLSEATKDGIQKRILQRADEAPTVAFHDAALFRDLAPERFTPEFLGKLTQNNTFLAGVITELWEARNGNESLPQDFFRNPERKQEILGNTNIEWAHYARKLVDFALVLPHVMNRLPKQTIGFNSDKVVPAIQEQLMYKRHRATGEFAILSYWEDYADLAAHTRLIITPTVTISDADRNAMNQHAEAMIRISNPYWAKVLDFAVNRKILFAEQARVGRNGLNIEMKTTTPPKI